MGSFSLSIQIELKITAVDGVILQLVVTDSTRRTDPWIQIDLAGPAIFERNREESIEHGNF